MRPAFRDLTPCLPLRFCKLVAALTTILGGLAFVGLFHVRNYRSDAQGCQVLLNVDGRRPKLSLDELLAKIPRLPSLSELPSGTAVLVRGDVDAPGKNRRGVISTALDDHAPLGRQRGWKQVIFGHIGRKPEETLAKVARRIGELMECEVPLVSDWLDESTITIRDDAAKRIRESSPGSILLLENTRRYEIERVLWKAKAADLAKLAGPLARFADQFAEKSPACTSTKRSQPAASIRRARSCRQRCNAWRWGRMSARNSTAR
jgi:hypothetical protein